MWYVLIFSDIYDINIFRGESLKKLKIQAEIVPNQNIRLYHTNFKMTDKRIGQMFDFEMMENEKADLEKATDSAKKISIGIMGIEGFKSFILNLYELHFEKVPLFDWEDIEPQIIGLIQMVGKELYNEEIEYISKPIWEQNKWGCPSLRDDIWEIP